MKYLAWVYCFLFLLPSLRAQENLLVCDGYKKGRFSASKSTIASPDENMYDVQYVKLDIEINNLNVFIAGNVLTTAKVIAPLMLSFVFELSDSLTVDSVVLNGQSLSFSHNNGLCTVTLASPLSLNTVFTSVVYYHGMPKTGNGFFDRGGMNNHAVDVYGVNITYTLSEPYSASDWWPCKQSLQDKIDSADIWITVPDSLKAGSNGLLKKITPLPGNKLRYEWHTNYPIDYYLLSVTAGDYIDYSFRVAIPGATDTLLVQNYIYDAPGAFDRYKKGFDSTAQILQYFSQIYGPYPFYKEKYGHCLVPLFGGMEHQTMTTCGNSGPLLVAHELAHQWWGDHVTCGTWKDVWLNEGFATYSEYLFLKKFRADTTAESRMLGYHNSLIFPKDSNGTIYSPDTNLYRLFDNRLSYNKAAAVIHTLRFVINNDSIFFAVLKKYQQQFSFKTATTEDFKQVAEQVTGLDLSVFFDQWIYKEGYPVYSAEWNSVAGNMYVKLKQTTTHPQSVSLFKTPIELRISFHNGDTIIRVENTGNEQVYKFLLNKTVTGISIDPNNKILNAERLITKNVELGLNLLQPPVVVPNPATDYWVVAGIPQGSDVILADLDGRVLKKESNITSGGTIISADGLPKGVYVLFLMNGNVKTAFVKLVKL